MPNDRRRLRVGFLCGGLPLDTQHMKVAGDEVEIFVYCSRWLPRPEVAAPHAPDTVEIRRLSPVVRARRGNLYFVYRGLSAALELDQIDVLHVVSEPWGLLAVQAAAWVRTHRGKRLVLHGCDTQWHHGGVLERLARRAMLRWTLPVTDGWLAESSKALAVASTSGLPSTSLCARIHTNPRDGQLFRVPDRSVRRDARAALGIAEDEVAIGLVGRLVPEKGVRQLLDAADLLLADGHPVRFLLAGDGPLRNEVEQRTSDRIRWLGMVSHPTGVVGLFQALDVLACPSLTTPTWEDQGPRSVLEAMMSGCVPVATPTGGLPEMLGIGGVVADSTAPSAIAEALTTAMTLSANFGYRSELACRAADLYSAEAVAEQLVGAWSDVACGRDEADVRSRT